MSLTFDKSFNRSYRHLSYTTETVISVLKEFVTKERFDKLQDVVSKRSVSIVPILERIYDRGNINAVMRSSEAYGYYNFHIVENEGEKFKVANRVSQGTDKWLEINKYKTIEDSVVELKQKGYQILTTSLNNAVDLTEMDFSQPTALIFGNEKEGVSEKAIELADCCVKLPMVGFAQSFNISVAAAISLHHVDFWKRKNNCRSPLGAREAESLLAHYLYKSVESADKILSESADRHHCKSDSFLPVR